jgi:hypothetical protein
LQRKLAEAAEVPKSANIQRGIREIITEIMRETTIGKRRISGSSFVASGIGISPRTA